MPYTLTFIKIIETRNFIKNTNPQCEEQELENLARQIGSCLFELVVDDGTQEKSLIKTKQEMVSFLEWYSNNFPKKKIKLQQLKQGYTFESLQFQKPLQQKLCYEFMQLENQDIFNFKSIRLWKKIKKSRSCDWLKICKSEKWMECQFVITSYGLVEKVENQIKDFYLFNNFFHMDFGMKGTGNSLGIFIKTDRQKLDMKANSSIEFYIFLHYLQRVLDFTDKKSIRYEASSFVRIHNKVDFIIDGEHYFERIAKEIYDAESEIFICGWWISPQLLLIRKEGFKSQELESYRLLNILEDKASKGVNISVIVFNDPPMIPNDSQYTKQTLEKLHPNIKVVEHPSRIIPGIWSHHQKIVVIDQKVAFLGGLDLCYGRYDDNSHTISSNSSKMYPGIDYNNNRIKDFIKVSSFKEDGISRKKPRLPWHDVALRIEGKTVIDICQHFIDYWEHCQIQNKIIQEKSSKKPIPYRRSKEMHQQLPQNQNLETPCQKKNQMLMSIESQRMRSLDQRRKQLDEEIFVKRKEGGGKTHSLSKYRKIQFSLNNVGLLKLGHSSIYTNFTKMTDNCQFLRSASRWSVGLLTKPERSIENAYIELILKAKTHIYIENQFFISATSSLNSFVKNQVANAIYIRIKMAIEKKEKFKVMIFIPLLPAFEGKMDESASLTMCLLTYWQYKTICRGNKSLLKKIGKLTPNPEEYIKFLCLRQHGVLEGKPVTEIIYVHSKLMIVDDETVICGSANINDRSLQGNRDSQVAVVVEQGKRIPKIIGGTEKYVSQKAHELRIKLLTQHFGCKLNYEDPLDGKVWEKMLSIAKINTITYRQLFGCYPDDNILLFGETHILERKPTLEQYRKHSKKIVGHCVQYPLQYLSGQNLSNFQPSFIHNVVI